MSQNSGLVGTYSSQSSFLGRGLGFIFALAIVSMFFVKPAYSQQATVAWNADSSSGVAGYDVYYGTSSGNYTYTLNVGNVTTATLPNLAAQTYYIAVSAYDNNNNQSPLSSELVVDSLSASAGSGGSISPSGSFFQARGASQTFTITPAAGYQISDVQVDGNSVGAVTSYTLSNISASHTISATFAPVVYTITASGGSGGSITPSGSVSVNCGASQTYTITPSSGYRVSGVSVDGASAGAVTSYTFSNVTANHTISATFAAINYTITASAGANGSISPSGAVSVASGGSKSFTITPAANYKISDVDVDGKSVGAVSSYTFKNMAANHTIKAVFASITYSISATFQGSGSISPAGVVSVLSGKSAQFTITPDTGYQVSMVVVDGESVGAVSSYSFTSVTANHSIEAFFTAAQSSNTASVQGNGTSSTSPKVSSGYARCAPAIQLLLLDQK